MEAVEPDPRLSQLSTQWSLIFDAHSGSPDQASEALTQLMLRYSGAVHRYLLKVVGDAKVVEELDQEFALRFLQGGFRGFDPSRGRFRDYVKQAVRHLMIDHFRRKPPAQLDTDWERRIVGETGLEDFDREFLESWRKELLERTWKALDDLEQKTGQPYHRLLRFRIAHPELRSAEMAQRLSATLGKAITAGGVRQALARARDKFAQLLVAEVRFSLNSPSVDELEEELGELKLLEYCRSVLRRMGPGGGREPWRGSGR